MTGAAAPALPVSEGPACGNCGQPMPVLALAGHYGRRVELDLCPACHLVWFDGVETANLAGPGLLALIGEMAAAQRLPHQPLRADLGCLRCGAALRTVHNRSRWGPSLQLACPQRHGAYQSFAQFLSEKGLARVMTSADRARLLQRDGVLHCINCGGDFGAQASECPWCRSVAAVIDVARLAQALDPEGATAGHAVHLTPAERAGRACLACGAALPSVDAFACGQCGATLAATGLADAHRRIEALGPALRAHADKPAPEVVKRRLAAHAPAMARQREWAADLQAEADAAGARDGGHHRWGDIDLPFSPWTAAVALLFALLAWWGWF